MGWIDADDFAIVVRINGRKWRRMTMRGLDRELPSGLGDVERDELRAGRTVRVTYDFGGGETDDFREYVMRALPGQTSGRLLR